MKMKSLPSKILATAFVGMFSFGFATVFVRTQTTLIGYQIGQLKEQEAKLLEERSLLRMQLAKMTNRDHLEMASEDSTIAATTTLASR